MTAGCQTFGRPVEDCIAEPRGTNGHSEPRGTNGSASIGGLGKTIEELVASYGLVYYRPEPTPGSTTGERAEQAELEGLAPGKAGRAATVAEKCKANEVTRRKFFQAWAHELVLPRWWCVPAIFCGAQLTCFFLTGNSLFGFLTGGVVESLLLITTGRSMRWHLFGGIAMWAVAAVQFVVKPFRHGRLAVVHRSLGRAFLLLWLLIVGPSAAYLSLFCGTGPKRAQFWMTVFAIVSLDTTMHAYYFFWRGWRIIRNQASGQSVVLHRKAMSAGLFFTMTILWQRPLQLIAFVGPRAVLLHLADVLQVEWPRSVALNLLDHNVGLAASTAVIGFPSLLLDGPRSWLARSVFDLSEEEAEELYGSGKPSMAEMLFWRLRHPAYLVLRAVVTEFWTVDPDS